MPENHEASSATLCSRMPSFIEMPVSGPESGRAYVVATRQPMEVEALVRANRRDPTRGFGFDSLGEGGEAARVLSASVPTAPANGFDPKEMSRSSCFTHRSHRPIEIWFGVGAITTTAVMAYRPLGTCQTVARVGG